MTSPSPKSVHTGPKVSDAQRRMLADMPDDFERWKPRRGMPFMLLNPTLEALIKRGFAEVKTMPPRWRRTAAGRQALSSTRGQI